MKKGYQLEFYMEQNERHDKKPLYEWLIDVVRDQGISGATAYMGTLGFGLHRCLHSSHFFELLDQPVKVMMIATEEEIERLLAFLVKEKTDLFYVKFPVEFDRLE